MTRMKGVSSPNVLHFSASPKLHRKPWSRGEERELLCSLCAYMKTESLLRRQQCGQARTHLTLTGKRLLCIIKRLQAKVTSELENVCLSSLGRCSCDLQALNPARVVTCSPMLFYIFCFTGHKRMMNLPLIVTEEQFAKL